MGLTFVLFGLLLCSFKLSVYFPCICCLFLHNEKLFLVSFGYSLIPNLFFDLLFLHSILNCNSHIVDESLLHLRALQL